jgi:CBS domain-containing protein
MQVLARHGISSLPVLNESCESFLGFIGAPELLAAFLAGDFAKREATERVMPPRHTNTAETLAAIPSRLPEDLPPRMPMLSQLDRLNEMGPKFASQPLSRVAPGRDGELLYQSSESQSLRVLIKEVLSPPREGVAACHRVGVFSIRDGRIHVDAVVSQSDVVYWLSDKMKSGEIDGALASASIEALQLSPRKVLCVSAETPAVEAFNSLLRDGLSTAGLVSSRSGGGGASPLVGALSLSDLRGLVASKLGVLALPVGEFLALRKDSVWSSAGSSHGSSAGASEPLRDSLMRKHTLLSLPPGSSFEDLVNAMAANSARAVFVLDAQSQPLSVVTASDVLRIISEGG